MEIYTIGFTQKSAAQFFGKLRDAGIKTLVDIRLNNSSQLAAFTKRSDLPFFLKEICSADYLHEPLLAPTQEILTNYKKNGASWDDYTRDFLRLMDERKVDENVDRALFATATVLLCSEPTPENCHRRLVAEYLQSKWGNVNIVHL
ncbi:hypothetical protein BH20CHL1_BH20CHL1_04370 [soil metagenome]|jgi:uncharacterized protein (DUF488 family)|nr:DUF488 domain-containing protein [Chloroflexia bacterium]